MQRLLTIVLLLAATANADQATAAVELITNGGGETGDLTGWAVTAGGNCDVSNLAHSGNWSLTGGVSGTTGP